ncbi:MAG TPA: MaoC/PaaZ C-terminal domain-containing protein [Aeromicrobium sp.]|nr:MaoC/PaaZ C-terminal domain-containing protein [Aeromicrobium sp.]
MPIDPAKAIGAELPEVSFAWTSSDVLLYHLAIGAGTVPGSQTDPGALRYTLDNDALQVLPSFGVVAPTFHETDPPGLDLPGCDINLAQVLHGSQAIKMHRPIPTSGGATLRTRITDVWDKGKAAVIVQQGDAVDASGDAIWTVTSTIFVRGEGGWGGDRGPSTSVDIPNRAPTTTTAYQVTPQQALLYRLCGDRNPLHADPEFAAKAGFPAPILHGLCTWGITLREATDALLDGDASAVREFSARFAGVVFPGDRLDIALWDEGDHIVIQSSVGDRPVLSDAVLVKAG